MRLSPILLAFTILALATSSLPAYTQALVAYYPFNGNANDASGRGHDGTVNGAALTADRFNQPNSAYSFDGNDYIEVPHSDELAFPRSMNFSLCAWVKFCRLQRDYAGIVAKGPVRQFYPGYQLLIRYGNRTTVELSNNDGGWTPIDGPTQLDDGRWHFLAMVVTPLAGRARLYVDGRFELESRSDLIDPVYLDPKRPLFIGKERNSDVFFNGNIDDVRLFNYAISDAQISQLYRENGWSGSTSAGIGSSTTVQSCMNTTTTLTAENIAEEYQWSTGETTREINVTQAGTYRVTGRDAAGCLRTDTVVVTYYPMPTIDAGQTTTICSGGKIVIGSRASGGAGGPYTYSWIPRAGLDDSTVSQPTASPTTTTLYTVRVTDARGCVSTDTVTVIVGAAVAQAGVDRSVCAGSGVAIGRLPGTPGYTYSWSPSQGLSADNIESPIASPATTTRYVLTVTAPGGCQATDTVVVTVHPLPTVGTSRDTTICAGSSVALAGTAGGGTGPYRYSWSPATGLDDASSPTPTARPMSTTRYALTVTDANGCQASSSLLVTISPAPMANAGADREICPMSSIRIGDSIGADPTATYSWSPATGLSDPTSPSPIASPGTTTKYVLTVTSANGCVAVDEMTVGIDLLNVDAGTDTVICPGAPVRIGVPATGGREPYFYSWRSSSGTALPNDPSLVVRPFQATTYTVVVTDANGCVDSASVNVSTVFSTVEFGSDLSLGYLQIDSVDLFFDDCDSLTIRNAGSEPLVIDRASLAVGREFDVSTNNYPIVIPPAESRSIRICYRPSSLAEQHDTLQLVSGCNFTIPLRAFGRMPQLEGTDDCDTRIAAFLDTTGMLLKAASPYPNPTTNVLAVDVEWMAARSFPALPASCALYDLMGNRVALGTYASTYHRDLNSVDHERGTFTIDLAGLPQGAYVVTINSPQGASTFPITIVR